MFVFLQVLKLHTKLGKPIPSSDPVVVGAAKTTSVATSVGKTTTMAKPTPVAPVTTSAVKKVLATPKITFVGMLTCFFCMHFLTGKL